MPVQQLLGERARRRVVEGDEEREEVEVLDDLVLSDADGRHSEVVPDDLGDLPESKALITDGMQARAGGGVLDRQPVQAGRVERVPGAPAVRSVSGVAGHASGSGERDQGRGVAGVVELAVDQGRKADDGRPDTPVRECDHGVFGIDAWAGRKDVALGPHPLYPAECEWDGPGRPHERLAGPGQRLAHGLDGQEVGAQRTFKVTGVHLSVLEREVDDAVRGARRLPETVEIVE